MISGEDNAFHFHRPMLHFTAMRRKLIAANWKMYSPPEGWDAADSPYKPDGGAAWRFHGGREHGKVEGRRLPVRPLRPQRAQEVLQGNGRCDCRTGDCSNRVRPPSYLVCRGNQERT